MKELAQRLMPWKDVDSLPANTPARAGTQIVKRLNDFSCSNLLDRGGSWCELQPAHKRIKLAHLAPCENGTGER